MILGTFYLCARQRAASSLLSKFAIIDQFTPSPSFKARKKAFYQNLIHIREREGLSSALYILSYGEAGLLKKMKSFKKKKKNRKIGTSSICDDGALQQQPNQSANGWKRIGKKNPFEYNLAFKFRKMFLKINFVS